MSLALLAFSAFAGLQEPPQELQVRVSGMNWAVSCGRTVTDGLKRLDGATAARLDDYVPGKGLFSVSFGAPPRAKPSELRLALPAPYVLDGVRGKISAAVVESDGVRKAGAYVLAKGEEDPAKLDVGRRYTLRGELNEDAKGVVTLVLDRVDALPQ